MDSLPFLPSILFRKKEELQWISQYFSANGRFKIAGNKTKLKWAVDVLINCWGIGSTKK